MLTTDDILDYAFGDADDNPHQFATPDEFIDHRILDDMTGDRLVLEDIQRQVLQAMFERDENGHLKYDTMLYSAPKKSGKTSIGGAVALWQAWRLSGHVYVIGNDLKQADNRMNQFIRFNLEKNPAFKDYYRIVRYEAYLTNNSVIHAIPVDPEGEAGMNPIALFWTEAWGAKQKKHELLWTEAALSPQYAGQSFKFVESYAGYKNESMILWRLYENIVLNGTPHPTIPELYTNGTAIAWWCTQQVLPAQTGEMGRRYYESEAMRLLPQEFDRQHRNQWADALQAFINIALWDRCLGAIPPPEQYEQQVVAIDASVSGDCTAMVSVSRRGQMIYIRHVTVWTPQQGQKIDYETVENHIIEYCQSQSVVCVVYDPYQMEYMAERLKKAGIWCKSFNQGADRLKADKSLHDRIMNQQIVHDGNPTLRQHILNSSAQIDKQDGKLRIIKSNESSKVDANVAQSMACSVAEDLNIG